MEEFMTEDNGKIRSNTDRGRHAIGSQGMSDMIEPERKLAARRDKPVTCQRCGRAVKRKARQQRFCSDRCSMRARSVRYRQQRMAVGALKNGGSYPTKGRATQPIQNINDFNGSQPQFSQSSSRISAPRHVIEVECFDGHIWTPAASNDGVAVMVSRLRQRALVTGQWMKAAA
jgi:hypothetical protein